MKNGLRVNFLLGLLLIASFLTACSPVVQEAGPPVGPPILGKDQFTTFDGEKLPVWRWDAEGKPEAILVAVHGFNDYSNSYSFPGSWWSQQGITTIAYDQRGFGRAPHFGIWPGEALLKRDLAGFVKAVKAQNPGVPVYLIGESMGGAVVMTAVTEPGFPAVDGIILSAPAVWGWQSLNLFYKVILWSAAHTVPSVKLTGQGLGIMASDNISMLRNLGADPLFIKETRIDSIYGLVTLMGDAYDAAGRQHLPLLLLYGAHDELVPREPVEEVVEKLPEGTDIVLYENGWHMLMRDLEAPLVWRDIESWIKARKIHFGNQIQKLPLFPDK